MKNSFVIDVDELLIEEQFSLRRRGLLDSTEEKIILPYDASEKGRWECSFYSPPNWMLGLDVSYNIKQAGMQPAKHRQLRAFVAAYPDEISSRPIVGIGVCAQARRQ